MSIEVIRRNRKWRLVETDGLKLARNPHGTPLDGGGHKNKAKAERQAGYINEALSRKAETR